MFEKLPNVTEFCHSERKKILISNKLTIKIFIPNNTPTMIRKRIILQDNSETFILLDNQMHNVKSPCPLKCLIGPRCTGNIFCKEKVRIILFSLVCKFICMETLKIYKII